MKILFIVAIVCVFAAQAEEIYVCKVNGKNSYVSSPVGEQCQLQSFGRKKPRTSRVQPALTPAPEKNKAAAQRKYPVVSSDTQKKRDKKRSQILLYELEKEQQRQQTAQEQLQQIKKEAPDNDLLISHLETQLHIHTQNIIAIKQELNRL